MKGNSATQPLCAISVTVLLAVVNTVSMKLTEEKVYLDLWLYGDKSIITQQQEVGMLAGPGIWGLSSRTTNMK